MMTFYKDDIDTETLRKMKHAPLTNSGCESRMAQLDVRVKFSGGAAPLDTFSDKQIVSVNKYLTSSDFDDDSYSSGQERQRRPNKHWSSSRIFLLK